MFLFACWWSVAAPAEATIKFVRDHLNIETSQGQTYRFEVELAVTPQQRAQGLMFREEMGRFEGMLFLFDREAPRSFWMRNTLLSLDLIFLNSKGEIVRIAPDAVPLDETPIPSGVPASAVLELLGGTAEDLALALGDRIRHRAFSP